MTAEQRRPDGELSPWWRWGVLIIVLAEFAVLLYLAGTSYTVGPPVPERVVGPDGETLFTGDDIMAGQQVFLKHGLMDNGTFWGHGAYLGPDFAATYLHRLAGEVRKDAGADAGPDKVRALLAENRYDGPSRVLHFTRPEAASYREQVQFWTDYFSDPNANRGLLAKAVSDPLELRTLTAFFAWGAWASVAQVPGRSFSYTNNFPYEPAIGNGPSVDAIIWSALSLVALLGGTAAILFAFGRFRFLGWRGAEGEGGEELLPRILPGEAGPAQRATLKFFLLVPVLFLAQTLVGGALAHYLADPSSFYGLNLAVVLPSNLLRTWHLQLAVFWIATAFVGGGLFLAVAVGEREPRGQVALTNLLFGALGIVVFGSLLCELAGMRGWFRGLWFWLGDQGWEYLELGRIWQYLLVVGFILWAAMLVRAVGPALKEKKEREMSALFLVAAFAIPLFYLPALFFGTASTFTVVDTWRFWIIHLWVEGFFELFATVMVATIFYRMGLVSRRTAARVIYLDAILFLGAGVLGTGHHWYWTGQSNVSMAISATFSAMEVVPLILLTLDASDFVGLTRGGKPLARRKADLPHRYTFYFLIAVGVWNFIGAGIFGFLINLPVVSYYEAGTNLTANHGHAAMMGVFGMLAVAFVVFAMRQSSADEHWRRVEKYVRVSFWGLNIGLAGMVLLDLFPSGVLQVYDVVANGYWHARSAAFLDRPLVRDLVWLRLPADAVFILAGVVPLLIAVVMTYVHNVRRK
jgi:nitric oxide reductase subunit B